MYTLHIVAPPSSTEGAGLERPPLGARDAVVKRLTDLLPGTEFDDRGRGSYRRGPYQIAFSVQGKEPSSISVAIDQAEGFTVMTRIAEKTGWYIVDPETNDGVDLEASRAAGRIVHEGEGGQVASSPASAGSRRWPARSPVIAGVAVAGALMVGVPLMWPDSSLAMKLPSSILASRRANAPRFEKYADRARRRAAAAKALRADLTDNPIVAQMLDMQMASRAYWNFIDGRFTSPELLSDAKVWSRFMMPSFLPDSFGKSPRDGYVFEFRGEGCEEAEPGWPECAGYVYLALPIDDQHTMSFALYTADDKIRFRTDGRIPQRNDPTIDRK